MRCPNRHHQELVAGYDLAAARNFAPAVALRTVDEDRFGTPILTRAGMSFCGRIISCVGGKQIAEQRIMLNRRQDGPGDNHDALPLKAFVLLAPFHLQQKPVMELTFRQLHRNSYLRRLRYRRSHRGTGVKITPTKSRNTPDLLFLMIERSSALLVAAIATGRSTSAHSSNAPQFIDEPISPHLLSGPGIPP